VTPALSILVCTRGRPEAAARAIRAILEDAPEDAELLVQDQSDGEQTREALAGCADGRLRYTKLQTRGLSRARNAGVAASRGPVLLFTDDDCLPAPGWAEAVLREFAAEPGLDALFGRVLPLGEGPEGWECPSVMTSDERASITSLGGGLQDALGHGNNMAFRRGCFERLGLFQEWLGAGTPLKGGEDTEFILRLRMAGGRALYAPAPTVFHDNWMPRPRSRRQLRGYAWALALVLGGFLWRGRLAVGRLYLRQLGSYLKGLKRAVLALELAGLGHFGWLLVLHGLGLAAAPRYLRRRPPSLEA